MAFLKDLKRASYKKNTKRRGKGVGSGQGKTAGRGHKGGKARSGYTVSPTFEGGQSSLAVKLPKRGFNNYEFTIRYAEVNLSSLENLDLEFVSMDELKNLGIVRANAKLLKILGNGVLSKKMTVKADKFSESARLKIEKAGGTVELV